MAAGIKKNCEELNLKEEDLRSFVRTLLPDIQAYYQTEEGKKAYQEWCKTNPN